MSQPSYRRTLAACYLGYVSLAVVNNLGPLLFSTFQRQFNIGVGNLTLLISLNFGTQLLTDLAAIHFVDRIGYRTAAISAGVLCTLGLSAIGILPFVFNNAYIGLVATVVINAIGGGLFDVLVNPIVESLPLQNKSAKISMLHLSGYFLVCKKRRYSWRGYCFAPRYYACLVISSPCSRLSRFCLFLAVPSVVFQWVSCGRVLQVCPQKISLMAEPLCLQFLHWPVMAAAALAQA
jgi:MFS family permease